MLKLRLDSKFLNFHISFLSTVTQLPLLFWKIGTATLFRGVFQCPCSSTLLGVPLFSALKGVLSFQSLNGINDYSYAWDLGHWTISSLVHSLNGTEVVSLCQKQS